MPTRCTEAAMCSGIRNSCPLARTRAGKPDSPDRTSGRPPALLRPSRSPKSQRPECALEPPWGLAAAIGLQFRVDAEIGIGTAIPIFSAGGDNGRSEPPFQLAVLLSDGIMRVGLTLGPDDP